MINALVIFLLLSFDSLHEWKNSRKFFWADELVTFIRGCLEIY